MGVGQNPGKRTEWTTYRRSTGPLETRDPGAFDPQLCFAQCFALFLTKHGEPAFGALLVVLREIKSSQYH